MSEFQIFMEGMKCIVGWGLFIFSLYAVFSLFELFFTVDEEIDGGEQ